jgi:hypothetical protein
MNTPSGFRFMLGFVALLSFVTVTHAGGWSLVTVKDLPDFAVAGKPLNLTFKAWVPSLEPLTGLRPAVRATHAKGRAIKVNAKAAATPGDYTAVLTFPEPGDWVLTFDTEYQGAATMPIKVIGAGTPAPAPLPLATRGLRLFTVKGCDGCHLRYPEVTDGRLYGPDLTGLRFPPEYLRKFLADPSITPVPDIVCSKDGYYCGSPYAMPNLNLTNAEIEALVAFINKKS